MYEKTFKFSREEKQMLALFYEVSGKEKPKSAQLWLFLCWLFFVPRDDT